MSPRIKKIRDAVETMHACAASHVESVPLVEYYGQSLVWEGVVEVFEITGHPKAKRCYAWSYADKGQMQFVGVLEIPPVKSPITAVQASIVASAKK